MAKNLLRKVTIALTTTLTLAAGSTTVANAAPAPVHAGTPITVGGGTCTLGAVLNDTVAITALHCFNNLHPVVRSKNDGRIIGWLTRGDKEKDVAFIRLNPTTAHTVDKISVKKIGAGAPVWKQGYRSGKTTGVVEGFADVSASGRLLYVIPMVEQRPHMVKAAMCALPGDSGGPVYSGDKVVGIVSAGTSGENRDVCSPGLVTYFTPIWRIVTNHMA